METMVMVPEMQMQARAHGDWFLYIEQNLAWMCDRDPVGVYGDVMRSEH